MTAPDQKCGNCKWLGSTAKHPRKTILYRCEFDINPLKIPASMVPAKHWMFAFEGTTCPTWKARKE